jgi:hypothetical protein
MSGAVTRKIELARQLEEMRVLHGEQQTELRANGRKRGLSQGLVDERLERQAAIIRTLEFCQAHEADIRAWQAQRQRADKGQQ